MTSRERILSRSFWFTGLKRNDVGELLGRAWRCYRARISDGSGDGHADERARGNITADLFVAETQLGKDGAVVLTLIGGLAEWRKPFALEMPRAAWQPVGAAVAVGDLLDRIPIFSPLHFGELLQRAHLAKRDLGLVQLCIERANIGKGQDPVLPDAVQFREIRAA